MYDTYVSNFYDDPHVELFKPEFEKLPISILINWNILPQYLSGKVIWTKPNIKKIQKQCTHKPLGGKEINRYFNREHWMESINQECMWVLFQDVLSFTANIMPEHYCNQFLRSFIC